MKQRHQQDRDAAGGRQPTGRRWIERSSPKRGASFVASIPAANTIMHGAREKQAKLDRREVQPFDQNARRRRKHREQSAHDQADGRGRNQEAAIGDQAEIVFGDGERIERGPRRMMGFAEHRAVGDGADGREHPDKDEFGAPAEIMIERAAEQRRETGRRRHRDHDQRHRAASAAPLNRSRAMARDSTDVAQAPAAWMTRPIRRLGRSLARPHQMLPARNTANPSAPASAGRSDPRSARPRAGRARTPQGKP